MMKSIHLSILLLFYWSFLPAQDCAKIRTGTFYDYFPHSYVSPADYTVITRHDSIELDIIPFMKDTILWKIQFENDCLFKGKVIRRTGHVSEATQRLYDNNFYISKVLQVTKDYYTYIGYWESLEGKTTIVDTIWTKRKF